MSTTAVEGYNSGNILLGVMGDPIIQSKSPIMHEAALRALGIPGAYVPLHIHPEKLGDAVQAIRTLGFRGVNVTIPHKVAVMEYLDVLDESAVAVGAVNTIVNDNGVLTGYNTDGIGYVRSLKAEAISDLSGAKIMVIVPVEQQEELLPHYFKRNLLQSLLLIAALRRQRTWRHSAGAKGMSSGLA